MKTLIYAAVILTLAFPLTACTTTGDNPNVNPVVTVDVNRVITPPATLFNCPQLSKLPNPSTLTNKDLANLITELMKDNRTCGYNMAAIQEYITKAKADIEAQNKKP